MLDFLRLAFQTPFKQNFVFHSTKKTYIPEICVAFYKGKKTRPPYHIEKFKWVFAKQVIFYVALNTINCYKFISSIYHLKLRISHVKIIAFQLSLFCKNYRFTSKTVRNIINRKIHGCLEIPDLLLVLNMISCSTLEINLIFPCTHLLFSI